ncbi:outer membrane beta-barrel family protein [Pedobacter sp. B4-66]|uniref:outer membrane beta-barrel family protein n=1 Tax=Pedobacter sp. B4-66 TaxID=2817280 RepID=UPI001BDA1FA8|nr:outer membrane beta-barrel family protein [Pedobacter sp. B4-66]
MMGYETLTKTELGITENTSTINTGSLQLIPTATMLNAVTIKATKPFIERRADKVIINMNDEVSTGSSTLEVMDKLPGVQVTPDERISLNGQSVQIFINGKATPLSSEALSGLLKGMSAKGIEKIELIAHPSAKYDASGGGGIINIIKKRNHSEGLSGNVIAGIGQGNFGKHNAGLTLNYKTNNINILFNPNYSFNKYSIDSKIESNFLNNSVGNSQTSSNISSIRSNRIYTPNLGLDFYLSEKTTLSASAIKEVQLFNKNATSFTEHFSIEQPTSNKEDFLDLVKTRTENFSSGLHLIHKIDTSGREYTVDFDYFNYLNNSDENYTIKKYGSSADPVEPSHSLLEQQRKFDVYAAKADYSHPLTKTAHIEAGWKSSYVISKNNNDLLTLDETTADISNTQNDYFKYSENINALYTTYGNSIKKLSYNIGLRAESTWGKGKQIYTGEQFTKEYIQLFPSVFFDYKFNKQHSLNLTMNKSVNRPTYENLNPLIRIINSNNYTQGNPKLSPSVSYNFSLTHSFKNALSSMIEYRRTLKDFTSFSSLYNEDGITTTAPINNNYSEYIGLHVAFNKQINKWWYAGTFSNMYKISFKSSVDGIDINNSGRLNFTFDTYNNFNITRDFSLQILFRYRGKIQERNITNDPYGYLVAGVRQSLFGKKATLAFNVTDIFNTYKIRYNQNSPFIRQVWQNKYETRIGRLSFTYNFGGAIKRTKTGTGANEEKTRTNLSEGY